MGGPFYGSGNDLSGSVTFQFGSTAELTQPSGLFAAPERNRLRSGTATGLSASLLLDDDTYTVLDPTEVSWSFDKPNLSLEGGKLTADILPERTAVRVEATAEGFTASFTIFILADKDLVAEMEKVLYQYLFVMLSSLRQKAGASPNGLVSFTMLKTDGCIILIWVGCILQKARVKVLGSGVMITNGYGPAETFILIYIEIAMPHGCIFSNRLYQTKYFIITTRRNLSISQTIKNRSL